MLEEFCTTCSTLHLLFSLYRVYFTLNDTGTQPRTLSWLPCSLVLPPPQWQQLPKHLVTYGSVSVKCAERSMVAFWLEHCVSFWASYFLKGYWQTGTQPPGISLEQGRRKNNYICVCITGTCPRGGCKNGEELTQGLWETLSRTGDV